MFAAEYEAVFAVRDQFNLLWSNLLKVKGCRFYSILIISFTIILGALGRKRLQVLKWKANRGKHDPVLKQYHFRPIAVLPAMQGHGMGPAILAHFCKVVDGHKVLAYLETD